MTEARPLTISALIATSMRDPRSAGRALSASGLGPGATFLMLGAAVLIALIPQQVAFALGGFDAAVRDFARVQERLVGEVVIENPTIWYFHGNQILYVLLGFAFISALARMGGALFGGTARPGAIGLVVSWWTLLQALLGVAIVALQVVTNGALDAGVSIIAIGLMLWLLYVVAGLVAGAHGFDSVGQTLAVGIALGAAFSVVLALLLNVMIGLFGAAS